MLPEKLSELRKKKGLSQIELAEKLNVSRQAVSRWETGGALPSVENLLSLRELYNVSLDYMVDDREGTEDTVPTDTAIPGPIATESRGTETSATIRRLRRALYAVSGTAILAAVVAIVSIVMLVHTPERDESDQNPLDIIDGESYVVYGEDGKPLKGESLEGYNIFTFSRIPIESIIEGNTE